MSTKKTVGNYQFIHNSMGHFVRGIASFLGNELYDDTTEVVIGTYAKAVQHYQNFVNEAGEKHTPEYPFISLDPRLDFEPEQQAGRFSYQYPNYDVALADKNWGPYIYQDDRVTIGPMLNRYKGSFEIIVWCRSVYELMDLRVLTYQFFGGIDRLVYPKIINSHILVPNEFRFHDYENPYTEQTYKLDWDNNKSDVLLVPSINKDMLSFPFSLRPWLKLTGVSDASEKYGGDSLSEYKLSIDLEWETMLPVHLLMLEEGYPEISTFAMDITSGSVFVNSNQNAPSNLIQIQKDMTTDVVTTDDVDVIEQYNYLVTAADVDNLDNDIRVEMIMPDTVADVHKLKLYNKYGNMAIGYEFGLLADNRTIYLVPLHLKDKLEEDDIINIVVYGSD